MSENFQQRKIGPLQVIEKRGDKEGLWVILFHGFGADSADLAPLAEVIKAPPGTNWLFPDGPLQVPIGPYHSGRAWFPIDMAEIERMILQGKHRDMSDRTPPGLDAARTMVRDMIAALEVPIERIVLGGFSQGAMIATDFSLHQETSQPRGMVLLSGTLLNRTLWSQLATRHQGLRYYQCHGTNDPILGYTQAKELHSILTASGLVGTFSSFNGGHEIPSTVVNEVGNFLHALNRQGPDQAIQAFPDNLPKAPNN